MTPNLDKKIVVEKFTQCIFVSLNQNLHNDWQNQFLNMG